jgi:predicted ATPase
MPATIATVRVEGLYGHQSMSVELRPGLNIVHARNGVGKTTLLHVLANLAERDVHQFRFLRFDEIEVTTNAGSRITLRSVRPTEEHRHIEVRVDGDLVKDSDEQDSSALDRRIADVLGDKPVYLPAFRSILEASGAQRRRYDVKDEARFQELAQRELREMQMARTQSGEGPYSRARAIAETTAGKTMLCREWFGQFVPVIRCPSLSEVSEELLLRELREAQFQVVNADVEASGNVFDQVLRAALIDSPHQRPEKSPEELAEQIRKHLEHLPAQYQGLSPLFQIPQWNFTDRDTTGRILDVYERALRSVVRAREQAFRRINTFLDSVNRFFAPDKAVEVDEGERRKNDYYRAGVVVQSGGRRMPLRVLSSGERQVLTLLFSATHMSGGGLLLIDEPELSLHLVWQRILLRELMEQAGERQVVVCTHAPELATEHGDAVRDLKRQPWKPVQAELELPEDKEPTP